MSDKIQKQISWFLVAKSLVKFVNDENSYKLSEKVMAANDFKKYPLLKGDTADISIEDGVVTYLRKVKKDTNVPPTAEQLPKATTVQTVPPSETPAPEIKQEVVTPSGNDVLELTVHAISADKKVIKFKENKDTMGWFKTTEEMRMQDFSVLGLVTKGKVKITYKTAEDGKPILDTVEKVAGEAPVKATESSQDKPSDTKKVETTVTTQKELNTYSNAQTVKKEWKPYSQNPDVQKSIECQACINSASNLVGMVAAAITNSSRKVDKEGNATTNAPTANVINSMVKAIAESNYQLLQELKSK